MPLALGVSCRILKATLKPPKRLRARRSRKGCFKVRRRRFAAEGFPIRSTIIISSTTSLGWPHHQLLHARAEFIRSDNRLSAARLTLFLVLRMVSDICFSSAALGVACTGMPLNIAATYPLTRPRTWRCCALPSLHTLTRRSVLRTVPQYIKYNNGGRPRSTHNNIQLSTLQFCSIPGLGQSYPPDPRAAEQHPTKQQSPLTSHRLRFPTLVLSHRVSPTIWHRLAFPPPLLPPPPPSNNNAHFPARTRGRRRDPHMLPATQKYSRRRYAVWDSVGAQLTQTDR